MADTRPARPRRQAVVWGGGALAAVALAGLGMLVASRLDSTQASSSANGPPPPTTREVGPRSGIGGAISTGAIPPPSSSRRTTTRVRTTAPTVLPPEVPTTSPASTTPTSPTEAVATLHWPPSAGAAVYWFELYRVGSLGARKILEARPEQAQFAIPRRAPDGTALGPGLYNWTASPQRTADASVHYTAETRAGRFRITPDGRIILRPR